MIIIFVHDDKESKCDKCGNVIKFVSSSKDDKFIISFGVSLCCSTYVLVNKNHPLFSNEIDVDSKLVSCFVD